MDADKLRMSKALDHNIATNADILHHVWLLFMLIEQPENRYIENSIPHCRWP